MVKDKKHDCGYRPLKTVALSKMEDTIAKSMSGLVDQEYDASIISVDFEPVDNSFLSDTVELKIRIERHPVDIYHEESTEE